MRNLQLLTKEDLIKVIANMHDTIQEWGNGWGLSDDEAETLIRIGRECSGFCVENNDWEIKDL